MLNQTWEKFDYRIDVYRATGGGHIDQIFYPKLLMFRVLFHSYISIRSVNIPFLNPGKIF